MKHRAFTVLELVMTLAVLGIVGSFAYAVVEGVGQRIARQKLESDVDTLNRAIGSYLAMGGSLRDAQTPAEVIGRLKTKTSDEEGRRSTGLSSSFVDARLGVRLASGNQGVVWDANRSRLVLDGTGAGAVAAFTLDDALAEVPAAEETRSHAVKYAKDSAWIWDYQDRAAGPAIGATLVSVETSVDPDDDELPAATTVEDHTTLLLPPAFSVPAGTYPIRDFDLSVTLTNPNPGSTSRIVYAIDYGNWRDYVGPVTVAPGSVLSAQTLTIHQGYRDSAKRDQEYRAEPATLEAPAIETDHPSFGLFERDEVEVTLGNPNAAKISRLEYRIGGGDWRQYDEPFSLSRDEHANGASIEARAVPVGTDYYLVSPIASRSIPVDPFRASGSVSGQFANAGGSDRMVATVGTEGAAGTFAWGELLPLGDDRRTDQSRLAFTGSRFDDVTVGQSFQIGSLGYYNGTILGGTGADRVDLTMRLDLTIGGVAFRPDFSFVFDLVNTVNTADAWASADFVRVADPVARQIFAVNDYEYEFDIEFGRTTSLGYSRFDEFHVLENAWASAELFGRLIDLGRRRR
ncbi:MAG: prepilin-type N-terminal cleavage/methylation domain-containing protein [Verrucomicrobiales bacterium]|nr:prepilin-type N-terminal cleavage/methylation domain-containing protein [Verrucomicrobiales bacterium]